MWFGSEHEKIWMKQGTPQSQDRAAMARQGTVALKIVVPVISKGVEEKAMLEEDLKQMGCHGLMLQSWSIKYEKIVQELQ